MWNSSRNERCDNCGSFGRENVKNTDGKYSSSPPRNHDTNQHSGSEEERADECHYDDHDDEGEILEEEKQLDEFGRVIPIKKKKQVEERLSKPPEWPPCFESNGSAFLFDSRSGMFYQAESDFFYDPKSKLYYGNKLGKYFKYNDSLKPPFEEVQQDPVHLKEQSLNLDVEPSLAPLPKPNSKTIVSAEAKNSKGITITLKTKSLKNPVKSNAVIKGNCKSKQNKGLDEVPQHPSRLQKQHASDIEKWSDRQVEKRVGDDREIQRTAKGEPFCPLCRRKFPSVEKLLYHERASQLHQENLIKQQQQRQRPNASTTADDADAGIVAASAAVVVLEDQKKSCDGSERIYVDRAQQRREMYGPETTIVGPSILPLAMQRGSTTGAVTSTSHPGNPEDNLNAGNIGNQLLQKMGWKDGNALGRVGSHKNETLAKDWEKIESLAANGGKPVGPTGRGLGLHH